MSAVQLWTTVVAGDTLVHRWMSLEELPTEMVEEILAEVYGEEME